MSIKKGHNYNFAMQKYLLLLEQHEEVSSHLEQIRPRKASITSNSTRSSSASSASSASPKRISRSSDHRKHGRARARCSGWDSAYNAADQLDTILDEETLNVISFEEQRLFDVNEGIKRALTELLNCETVRGDGSMRAWAQARLMETEKELRSGRRRKGSSTVV